MPLNTHDEFRELCAIATSGCLTDQEQVKLEMHLTHCRECRAALREYDRVARVGMPSLVPDFPITSFADAEEWSEETAQDEFFARLDLRDRHHDSNYRVGTRRIELKSPAGKPRISPIRLALPYAAAAAMFAAGLGWLGYRIGTERAQHSPLAFAQTPAPGVNPTADAGFSKERASLRAQVDERNRAITRLSDQAARQTAEVEKLLQERRTLSDSLQKAQTESDQKITERIALGHSLEQLQTELTRTKKDLEAEQQLRAEEAPREAELEARMVKLADQLNERDAKIDEQRELLARDKDIRDLMGARDLYIVDTSDVAGNGETKKPTGRIFYTKEKSLIFYAYDLDQQPGLTNASIFQAWGRRGPDLAKSVSLGMFYVDSSAHKRWVLKFNDAKSLTQMDAVFVTVEPKGGSQKPTGKPLLFSYLRVEPNHP